MIEYEKARPASRPATLDVAVMPQSAAKTGAVRARRGRVESIETQAMIRRAKAKICRLSN